MTKIIWFCYLVQAEGKSLPQHYFTRQVLEIGHTYTARLVCERERFTALALIGKREI